MGVVSNIAFLSGVVALLGLAADAEVLWSEAGPITNELGKLLVSVDVGDEMHFSMDVTINSFPSGDWASVLQCGTNNVDRWPGIFIHPSNGQFYFQVTGGTSAGSMGNQVTTDKTYHLDVDYSQSWWTVRVDGETIRSATKSAHSTREAVPCYASSNFGHKNADVTIENLVISTDIGCWFKGYECGGDQVCQDDGTCTCGEDSDCADHLVCHDDGECGRDCAEFPVDDWLLDCSAEFGENENDIADLQSSVVTVNGDIQSIQSTLSGKADTSTTDSLQSDIDSIDTDIVSMKSTLSGKADTSVTDSLQSDVDSIDTDIVSMKGDIQTMQSSLGGKADTSTTDALQASIDAINQRLDKLMSSAHSVPAMVDRVPGVEAESMQWTLTGKDMTIVALLAVNLVIIATLCVVCRTGSGGKYVYGQ